MAPVEVIKEKDDFLLRSIRYFKCLPSVAEQGVLLFIALLTSPNGSLVEVLPPVKEGSNGRIQLDGRSVENFITHYGWQVDPRAIFRGLKVAAVHNVENRLADIQLPKGKGWREGTDLQRFNWLREELSGITNLKELDGYYQAAFNKVASGKALPAAVKGVSGNAASTAAAAIEVATEKATSRKEQAAAKRTVVEKLNGKSRDTQSNSEPQPVAADVVPRLKKVLGVMTRPDFDRGLLFSELVAVFSTNEEEFKQFAELTDICQEALATAAELLAGNEERISTSA